LEKDMKAHKSMDSRNPATVDAAVAAAASDFDLSEP
jgi:hypothetical protein